VTEERYYGILAIQLVLEANHQLNNFALSSCSIDSIMEKNLTICCSYHLLIMLYLPASSCTPERCMSRCERHWHTCAEMTLNTDVMTVMIAIIGDNLSPMVDDAQKVPPNYVPMSFNNAVAGYSLQDGLLVLQPLIVRLMFMLDDSIVLQFVRQDVHETDRL
jgi:hypothetical protein